MNNVVIFLSSTFADMQKERDLIREKIAPDLTDFTQRYGVNLEFVDLRWGIDTGSIDENEANSKILRTCFDEIKRTRPFFIVLLGERYGWTPDDNDLLAVAVQEGLEVEQLREKSITELEIDFATHYYPCMDRCLFYFRDDVDYGNDIEAHQKFVSTGESKQHLDALKAKLSKQFPNQVKSYSARWDINNQEIVDLDAFEKQIIQDVTEILQKEFEGAAAPQNEIDEAFNIQQSRIVSQAENFSGRRKELEKIDEFVGSSNGRLMVLFGKSGCGKSSLMSKLATVYENRYPVLKFFAGTSNYASSAENLIKMTTYELCRLLGRECVFNLNSRDIDYNRLAKTMYTLLGECAKKYGKVIFVVDALNQFAETSFSENIHWLNPYALPFNVKVVVSCTDDYKYLNILKGMASDVLSLDYLDKNDIVAISSQYFYVQRKQVNEELISVISEKPGAPCRDPLYLITLLNRINGIGKDDFIEIDKRKGAGANVSDIIFQYLCELVELAPNSFPELLKQKLYLAKGEIGDCVDVFACAIAYSRFGISEADMLEIFKQMDIEFSAAEFSYFRKLFGGNILQRETGMWDFSHNKVKDLFKELYKGSTVFRLVSDAILSYLYNADNELLLKRIGYAHWLGLKDRLDEFLPYFAESNNDSMVVSSLIDCIQSSANTTCNLAKLFNGDSRKVKLLWDFCVKHVEDGEFSPEIADELCKCTLNSIYAIGEITANRIVILNVYLALGKTAARSSYYNAAIDYYKLALDVATKYEIDTMILMSIYDELARLCNHTNKLFEAHIFERKNERIALKYLERNDDQNIKLKLLDYYSDKCDRMLKSIFQRRSSVIRITKTMSSILIGLLDDEAKLSYASKILKIAARTHLEKSNEYQYALSYCESYIVKESSGISFVEVALSLAEFYSGFDIIKARDYINLAYAEMLNVLSNDNAIDKLKLFGDVLRVKKGIIHMLCENTEVIAESIAISQNICMLSPNYQNSQKLIEEIQDVKFKERKQFSTYLKEAKKIRRKSLRGVSSSEQKSLNKSFFLALGILISIYLIIPQTFLLIDANLFASVFDYSIFEMFSAILSGGFQGFINGFLCFALFALIKSVSPLTDYFARRYWIARVLVFSAISVILVALYKYVYDTLGLYNNGTMKLSHVVYTVAIGLEFALIDFIVLTLINYLSYQRNIYPVYDMRARFVGNFGKSTIDFILNLCFLGAVVWLYNYMYYNFEDVESLYGAFLIMHIDVYYIVSAVIAVIMLICYIRLAVKYVIWRKKL